MKARLWPLAVMAAVTFGFAGCKKAENPVQTSIEVNGVSVDMPKLQETFSTVTNSDVRKILFDVDQGFRYRDYIKSLMALDQLSTTPDLTEAQKKVVADVIEQLKKLANAPAPAPPPAH